MSAAATARPAGPAPTMTVSRGIPAHYAGCLRADGRRGAAGRESPGGGERMPDVGGSPTQWTWKQVCAYRLDRHLLSAGGAGDIAEVAARTCGVHAQVMSAAELSVGLRLQGATRVTVRQ